MHVAGAENKVARVVPRGGAIETVDGIAAIAATTLLNEPLL